MIIYGMRHYGPADGIEGVGEVQTRFIHIWFIPLIPIGSTFVVGETDDGVQGVPVGLSFRSIFVAWTRAGSVLGALGAIAGGSMLAMAGLLDGADAGEKLMKGGMKAVSTSEALGVAGSLGGAAFAFFGLLFCVFLYWGVGRLFRHARGARKAELMGKLGIAPGVDDAVMD